MLNHGDEVDEYTWTQASCDMDFFCMHTWIQNDVHRFYTSFSRQRPFFYFRWNTFVTLVSRICESLYWGWLELIAWFFFYFPPSVYHSSTLSSWLVWPARPWIWCHFNIGLIPVVQIKSYEQCVWVWHQYLPITLFFRPTRVFFTGSMRRFLQPIQVAQVVQLLQDGTSIGAVARRFAVSPSTVSRAWRRYQVTGHHTRRAGHG